MCRVSVLFKSNKRFPKRTAALSRCASTAQGFRHLQMFKVSLSRKRVKGCINIPQWALGQTFPLKCRAIHWKSSETLKTAPSLRVTGHYNSAKIQRKKAFKVVQHVWIGCSGYISISNSTGAVKSNFIASAWQCYSGEPWSSR